MNVPARRLALRLALLSGLVLAGTVGACVSYWTQPVRFPAGEARMAPSQVHATMQWLHERGYATNGRATVLVVGFPDRPGIDVPVARWAPADVDLARRRAEAVARLVVASTAVECVDLRWFGVRPPADDGAAVPTDAGDPAAMIHVSDGPHDVKAFVADPPQAQRGRHCGREAAPPR